MYNIFYINFWPLDHLCITQIIPKNSFFLLITFRYNFDHAIVLQMRSGLSDHASNLLFKVGSIFSHWIVQQMESEPSDHAQESLSHSRMLSAIWSASGWTWTVWSHENVSAHRGLHLWTMNYFRWTAPWLYGPSDRSTVHQRL